MRISDWSSDVCSSDLTGDDAPRAGQERLETALVRADAAGPVTSQLSNGTQAADLAFTSAVAVSQFGDKIAISRFGPPFLRIERREPDLRGDGLGGQSKAVGTLDCIRIDLADGMEPLNHGQ